MRSEISKMIRMVALAILAFWIFLPVYAAGDIDWHSDIEKAYQAAKTGDKIIMVDVYTDWCTWCDKLDEEVYTDSHVIELAGEIISLKVDAEDGAQGQSFAQRYGVDSFPTIIFLRADGREIDRIGGFLPAHHFLEEMRRIKEGRDTFLSLQEAEEAGSIEAINRLVLAEHYLMRSRVQEAESPVARFLESYGGQADDNTDRAYTILAQVKLSGFEFEQAEQYLLKLHKERPESALMPRVLLMLVYSRAMQNDKAGAKTYADELKRRFSGESQAIAMVDRIMAQM